MVESKIAQNEIKSSISRRNTIDQEIHIKKEEPLSIRRPSSSKPDSRTKTPVVTTKKDMSNNVYASRAIIIPSRIINSAASNRRASDTPTNYLENHTNKMNMKISPSSSNIRSNNSNSSNHQKNEANRGINLSSNK
jgi:hypothetical protein